MWSWWDPTHGPASLCCPGECPVSATPEGAGLHHTAPMSIDHNATGHEAWTDAVAWARKALARDRAESGIPGGSGQDPDLVVAVAAWVWWDRPPVAGVMVVPHALRTPRELPPGSAYELALLSPLHAHTDLPAELVDAWGKLTLVDQLYDQMGVVGESAPTGEIVEGFTVEQRILVELGPESTDEPRLLRCPVCDRDTGIRMGWDRQVARAMCPDGHAEWTPQPLMVAGVWKHMMEQVNTWR